MCYCYYFVIPERNIINIQQDTTQFAVELLSSALYDQIFVFIFTFSKHQFMYCTLF